MSLPLYFSKLRSGKAGAGPGKTGWSPRLLRALHSQLSARRSARVALPQSPILRVCRGSLEQEQKMKKKALPPNQKVLPMS